MPEPTRAHSGYLALVLLLAAASILIGLDAIPLTDPDEGRNAEVAREMLMTGSFLVPSYNGLTYLDKPALYFDLVAGALAAFGATETAARLTSALFGVLTLVLAGLAARRFYGARTAALAVLVIASAPLFIAFSRTVIFDMALTFFVCAALFAGFIALEEGERGSGGWHGLAMLAASLATLVKGPVGFLLPLLGLLVYARLTGVGGGRRFFSLDNLLIFFVPVIGWFVALSIQVPDFPYYGLVKESLARFTATAGFERGGPLWYYLPVIVAVFFPWSLLLPELVVRGWRRRRQAARADVLLAVFALVVVAFFSVSRSKLPGYVLPAVVALGILTARLFDAALARPAGPAAGVIRRGTLILALLGTAAGGLLAADRLGLLSLQQLFHIKELRYAAAQVMAVPLMLWFLGVGAAAAAAFASRRVPAMLAAFALPIALFAVTAIGPLQTYAEGVSSRPLAQAITRAYPQGPEIACLHCYPPGLAFYLGRGLTLVSDDGREIPSNYIAYDLKTPPWPAPVVHPDGAAAWLGSRTGAVLLLSLGPAPDPWAAAVAAARGLPPVQLCPHWWAVLVPPPGP